MKKGKRVSTMSAMQVMSAMVSPGSTGDGISSNTDDIPGNSETLPSPADSGRTMTDMTCIADVIPAREPEIVPGSPKRRKFGGRQKGTPNRITRDVRTALRDLAENNADQVQGWLDSVAQNDPAEAIRLYLMLCRFVVPILSARAIADITPKSRRETLAAFTDAELMEIILQEQSKSRALEHEQAPTTVDSDEEEIDELMR